MHILVLSSSFLLQLENITQLVAGVTSEDRSLQLEATIGIRKLLSVGL